MSMVASVLRPFSSSICRSAEATARRCFAVNAAPSHPTVEEWKANIVHKKLTTRDQIVASPINLLANTLNETSLGFTNESLPEVGTVLPVTYHRVFFPPRTPERDLAVDGYEQDFFPPPPFSQRLWAGAELTYSPDNPLRVGDDAVMTTTVDRLEHRRGGRLGESIFIWLNRDITNAKGWAMREQRCLAYLTHTPTSSGATPRSAPAKKTPEFSMVIHPSSILLFRYSALTFNSHMIHYDHEYATKVENHPACLVHGPLSGTLLMTLLRSHLAKEKRPLAEDKVRSFQYRCLSPLYVNEPLTVCGRQLATDKGDTESFELWVENQHGQLAVKGQANLIAS